MHLLIVTGGHEKTHDTQYDYLKGKYLWKILLEILFICALKHTWVVIDLKSESHYTCTYN